MGSPHILVIPYPVQGHVLPLMNLSQCLAQHGFKITFVNTEFNHAQILNSLQSSKNHITNIDDRISLVSVPDGLQSQVERNTPGKLSEAVLRVLPAKVEELMNQINASTDGCGKISCVLADQSLGWALGIAERHGIKRAAFCPASAAALVLGLSIQKLIDDGIVDVDGTPRRNETIRLSPGMPEMNTANFVWACLRNKESQRNTFQLMVQNNESLKSTDWLLCNSVYELEPAAFALAPQIRPIGPISAIQMANGKSSCIGSFWHQDQTCLDWLDQQEPGTVIYIAFGSFALFGEAQLRELALGLELTNRPFLWVTSADNPEKPMIQAGTDACIVAWAPQREVLSHRSIGCFLSHCGWNSTIEGASNGVPFLCWPYFADQFITRTYICDVWKIGLGLERDERGIVSSLEIRDKVDEVLGDLGYKQRALGLKGMVMSAVKETGGSYKNFQDFVDWIKG